MAGPVDPPADNRVGRDSGTVLGSVVSRDRAGWWVELTVGFAGGSDVPVEVVRTRVGPYLTERVARVAAGLVARAAARAGPPATGL